MTAKRTPSKLIRVAVATGKKVLLRHPEAKDRDEFLALRQASREFLERWEPAAPPGVEWNSEAAFERIFSTSNTPSAQRFFVRRLSDDCLVGQLSLGAIMRGPLQQCFMGYWIGEQFARQGFMTEAVKLGQEVAFRQLNLHRIEVNMQPSNEPSRRLAEVCGFRREGYSPKYLEIAGQWVDHERWAMTVEDYDQLRWARKRKVSK